MFILFLEAHSTYVKSGIKPSKKGNVLFLYYFRNNCKLI